MLRLSLAQMRRSAGRLIAAGIAIAIGAAFVAATLLAGNIISSTTTKALTASLADADVVVMGGNSSQETIDTIADMDGVEAVDGTFSTFEEISAGAKKEWAQISTLSDSEQLTTAEITEGKAPSSPNDIVLPEETAERIGVSVGDSLHIDFSTYVSGTDSDDDAPRDVTFTISGLSVDSAAGFMSGPPPALLSEEGFEHMVGSAGMGLDLSDYLEEILVAGDGSHEATQLRTDIESVLSSGTEEIADSDDLYNEDAAPLVRTAEEQAEAVTEQITGDSQALTIVVLGFAIIALFVAGLVIANTFQVLVAQRTKQLALLRCVGATKAQISRSVLIESLILGVIASAAGLALGGALAQGTLTILNQSSDSVPLPDSITLTPTIILVPLLIGIVVTVLSAMGPARRATRVAPLEALRPADAPAVGSKAGKVRLTFTLLGVIGGGLLLAGGVLLTKVDMLLAFLVAILGGITSFIGLILGAVFFIPKLVGALGRFFGRLTGSTAAIATANTVRNPRRTAATATALLIGVTLVTMMSTGAAVARSTMNTTLNETYPVDISAGLISEGSSELSPQIVDAIRDVSGIDETAEIVSGEAEVSSASGSDDIQADGQSVPVAGLDDEALKVAKDVESLASDEVLIGNYWRFQFGFDGDDSNLVDSIVLSGPDGDVTLRVAGSTSLVTDGLAVKPEVLDEIGADAKTTMLWASIDGSVPAMTVATDVQDTVSELTTETDSAVPVEGAAMERAMFEQVIDTMLLVIVGLLGVAVVIALIGVANTLSLSVIERRRESALLRALGLTKGRLRAMLAIEAMLITGVGAVVGVLLGLIYGYAGAAVVFSESVGPGMSWAFPVRDIAIVLGVAVVAGLLASILPARSATKTPPVAALAED